MPENKHLRFLLTLLYLALGAAGTWLGLRFLLPWLLPFLIALCLAALLERPVVFLMNRLRLARWVASATCTAALGLLLVSLLGVAAWRLWYETALLLDRLPSLLAAIPAVGSKWEDWVYRFIVAAPVPMQAYFSDLLNNLAAQSASLPTAFYGLAVKWAGAMATAVPDFFLALFTTAIATYFCSSTRPAILLFLRRQLPRRWRGTAKQGWARMKRTFGAWLRAQGLLMLITGGELAVGFLVLGVDWFLLLAALVAVVDALPVFGTGTILLPWAAITALGGDWKMAVGLLILYWVVSAVRGLLEPKLVGDRVGLPPLAALVAMYVGFQTFGVGGMIFAPLLAMFLKELHDCGFLRLWRD